MPLEPMCQSASRAGFRLVVGLSSLIAVAVRIPAIARSELLFDSDNALGPLMSEAIWRGGYHPLMLDGQDYLGALDAYLLAPLVGALGPGTRFWAIGQTLLLAMAVIPLVCAIGRRIGGTWGALAAGLIAGTGPPETLALTTSAPLAYVSNLGFGAAILLVATDALDGRRLALLGALVAAAWWNNPQVAIFVLPAALAVWAQSASARSLAPTIATRVPGRVLAGGFLVAALLVALVLAVPLVVSQDARFGPIAVNVDHGPRYLGRILVALALFGVAGECWVSRARWRLARGASVVAAGAVLGAAPLLLYRLTHDPTGIAPVMELRLDHVSEHWTALTTFAEDAVYGRGLLGGATVLALAAAAAALLFVHGRELVDLVRLRSRGLDPALVTAMPAAVLAAIMLLRGPYLSGPRHYLGLIVATAALAAAATGMAARRSRVLAVGVIVAIAARGVVGAIALPAFLDTHERPDREQLMAWLESRSIRHGYGQYWVAFELTLLGRGDLLVACHHDPVGNRNRFRAWKARVDAVRGPLVAILDLEWPANDAIRVDDVLDHPPFRLLERRSIGPRYLVLRGQRDTPTR